MVKLWILLLIVVLLSPSSAVAAPRDASGLPSVLDRIAEQLELLLQKNQTVTVVSGPVNMSVQPLVNVSITTSHVNVSVASCDGVPRRSSQYYEASLTDNVTVVVMPLPNGNCTVVYTVTVPRPGLGRIEAFDGFSASQTKTCSPFDTLCAQHLIITNNQPFAKITVPNGQSYPTFLISYACI